MTEFDDVIRRLEENRPQATPIELDEIKQRVRRRAADPSRKGSQSMKSRFAILAMLVTGMLFSTAGAGLAVSGLQSGGDASVAQYATPTPQGEVLPAEEESQPGEEEGVLPAEEDQPAPTPDSAPAAETGSDVAGRTEALQPARQVAGQNTGQLPMTGFAAIPVLLGGLALLTGGLVLRRRTRAED
jgi:LPXTG-motif cell wall-anchored protein